MAQDKGSVAKTPEPLIDALCELVPEALWTCFRVDDDANALSFILPGIGKMGCFLDDKDAFVGEGSDHLRVVSEGVLRGMLFVAAEALLISLGGEDNGTGIM